VRSLAVIGPLASDSLSPIGPWSGAGRAEDAVSVLAGLRQAMPGTRITHVQGVRVDSVRVEAQGLARGAQEAGIAAAERAARAADAVVLVLGEHRDQSGEAASRASIELPGRSSSWRSAWCAPRARAGAGSR
jgi:beta-glucosidase